MRRASSSKGRRCVHDCSRLDGRINRSISKASGCAAAGRSGGGAAEVAVRRTARKPSGGPQRQRPHCGAVAQGARATSHRTCDEIFRVSD